MIVSPPLRAPSRIVALALVTFLATGACGESGGDTSPSTSTKGSGQSNGVGQSSGAPLGEPIEGIATFYDADGTGNCGFDRSSDLMVAALNMAQYDGSNACGTCLAVKGPKGSVTVHLVDSCPPCEKNHVDLSAEAFAKIADPDDGRVPITWQKVACGSVGPMAFRFQEGSSIWWTSIQVRNHKLPVAKVEYERDGAFVAMPRADYNYFVAESGVGEQPAGLKLRVTAIDGQSVVETLAAIGDGNVVEGTVQFK